MGQTLKMQIRSTTNSVPTKTVLRHDGCTDALLAYATAIAASCARPAVSTTAARTRRVATIGTGHEKAAHATTRSLAHLAHGRNRAGALVALLLLAVATSDVDHSGRVGGSAADGTDTDAN